MYFALTKSSENIKIDNTLTIWLKAHCNFRDVDFARGEKIKDRALEQRIIQRWQPYNDIRVDQLKYLWRRPSTASVVCNVQHLLDAQEWILRL